jgi:hypothetical protein
MSWLQVLRGRYSVDTDPLRTQRRIELVALALAVVICLQLVWGFTRLWTLDAPDALAPAEDALRVPEVRGPQLLQAAQRNEIISRPLFWAGRRPLDELEMLTDSQPEDDEAPAELASIKLVGVFGDGETAGIIALVKGKKRRILLDSELEGWTLESIAGDKSVFVRGARRETLSLQREYTVAIDRSPPARGAAAEGAGTTAAATGADPGRSPVAPAQNKPAGGKTAPVKPPAKNAKQGGGSGLSLGG